MSETPDRGKHEDSRRFMLRIRSGLFARLEQIAGDEYSTVSEVIRRAIVEYVQRKDRGEE